VSPRNRRATELGSKMVAAFVCCSLPGIMPKTPNRLNLNEASTHQAPQVDPAAPPEGIPYPTSSSGPAAAAGNTSARGMDAFRLR
jgi:hypothetical protein